VSDAIQLADSGTIIGTLTAAYLRSPQVLTLGPQNLRARFTRQPTQIRKLKFLVVAQNSLVVGSGVNSILGFTPSMYMQVRIKAGRHSLTNDFVSLAVLNQRINDAVEFTEGPANTGGTAISKRSSSRRSSSIPTARSRTPWRPDRGSSTSSPRARPSTRCRRSTWCPTPPTTSVCPASTPRPRTI
jgi:hypothetical protein